jgi:Cu(I)/Ag(I) efflux system membrane fusion protein
MTRRIVLILVFALCIGLGLGFWLARKETPQVLNPPAVTERKPLYFRHPMNPKVTSPIPAKDEMGMDYVPVYAEESVPPVASPKQGRILYYRHPMGAADTSPTPKKDEMGMDYIPVYEGEVSSKAQVMISPEKIQKLGVKTEKVVRRKLVRTIRALGSIQVDERRIRVVTTKF